MAKTFHHGYADLVVTESYTESSWTSKKDDELKEHDKHAYTKRYTLVFDGVKYPLPDELKSF
jgi:hypothetical protein